MGTGQEECARLIVAGRPAALGRPERARGDGAHLRPEAALPRLGGLGGLGGHAR